MNKLSTCFLVILVMSFFNSLNAQQLNNCPVEKMNRFLQLINDYYVDSLNLETIVNKSINNISTENKLPISVAENLQATYLSPIERMFQFLKIANTSLSDGCKIASIVDKTIANILQELDPHSIYIDKDDVKKMNEPLIGNFEGIGVNFNILKDTILVVSTVPHGPGEKIGILPGDRIISVGGENVAGVGISTELAHKILLGQRGSKVKVRIFRKGTDDLLSFEITRDQIPINSVDAAYMVNENIGYIKLNRFSATSLKEFNTAIERLRKDGLRDLIVDLRDNGGGYLNVAANLADELIEDGKEIVYTEGITSPKRVYRTSYLGNFENGNLVVLINENSASASEILSGAVQDWDRGVIMGRRSFGKGLVQRPFTLNDGSIIRLTTARYYTPTGRLIQKPYDNGVEEYRQEICNRKNQGEFTNADSVHFQNSMKYYTLNNSRVVYGGGGIMPDVFIPVDTASSTDYYKKLICKGILNEFVLYYIDSNRESIKNKYPNFNTFLTNFSLSDSYIDNLVEYAEEANLSLDFVEFEKSKTEILLQSKAYIAQYIYDNEKYFQVVNSNNDWIKKAVDVLSNEENYLNILENIFSSAE